MLTRSKTILAASLVLGLSSVAHAQGFDPNLANRYPADADPYSYGYTASGNLSTLLHPAPHGTFQSAPVHMKRNGDAARNSTQHVPQYTRRIPGNQGDTSYGQDWAESYGGGF